MEKKGDSHTEAVERLDAAREERDLRAQQHEAARGSNQDLSSFTELKRAEDQFAAREAWLTWVERGHQTGGDT